MQITEAVALTSIKSDLDVTVFRCHSTSVLKEAFQKKLLFFIF